MEAHCRWSGERPADHQHRVAAAVGQQQPYHCDTRIQTSSEAGEPSVSGETLSKKDVPPAKDDLPFDVDEKKPAPSKKTDDVAAAFDDLFNG